MTTAPQRILLGRIAGAHGIRGEVLIHAFTQAPESICAYGALSDASGGRAFKIRLVRVTPKGVIAKLNAAVVEALSDPQVRQRFADMGQKIFPIEQQTPDALAALQKADIEKWWPVIKAANIKGE